MDSLVGMMPLIKIFFVFFCMLAGIRLKFGLGPSVLGGSVVLALLMDMGAYNWFYAAIQGLMSAKTGWLVCLVSLIMVLSGMMERTGQSRRVMDSLTGFLKSPRLRLVFFPSLIGLLPMPGGAIFSAPMIKEAAKGLDVSDLDKAVLNYWFRHVWELAWPLYPGMILAAAISGLPIFRFVGYTAPGVICCLLLGYFFYLRPGRLPLKASSIASANETQTRGDARAALREGLPLIVAIGGSFGLEALLSVVFPGVPFEAGIVAALTGAILCVALRNRGSLSIAREVLTEKKFLGLVFMIISVFVFKDVLGESGLVEELSQVAGGETALIAAAVLVPFLVGVVSGITMAFVGAAMPLVVGLAGTMNLGEQLPAWVVLCMFSGFSGIMASPIHICFLLTCQYFGIDLYAAWKRIIIPCALLLTFGVAYFFVLL